MQTGLSQKNQDIKYFNFIVKDAKSDFNLKIKFKQVLRKVNEDANNIDMGSTSK